MHFSKSLSQNFLSDPNTIRKFVDLVDIEKPLLEIGPGSGAITNELKRRGAEVIAIEKDRRLVEEYGWIEGDILTYDLESLPVCNVISNLPFSVTAPILTRLLPRRDLFGSLTLIVQKELAERMLGKPMGRFSILCQFYADISYGFTISKNCFIPKPKVEAAAVQLTLKEPPKVDEELFFALVKKAFHQRRKMIGKTVGRELVEKAGLDPTLRPERLSLDDFVRLLS